jgi:two-component system, NarL family, sensor histidine kinase DegS
MNTYTRNSMNQGTVAAGSQVRGEADPGAVETGMPSDNADARMAMALLDAHEQERQRLAEELHDGPAQAFANAIFQTQIAERALRDDPDVAQAELAALRTMLERELDVLRGYINQLRPTLREAAGLEDALRDNAQAITQRTGLPIDLRLEADAGHLHVTAQTVVLRVAQEALRNIVKHADAKRAWLSTTEIDAADGSHLWLLEVGDDGRGFDYQSESEHPQRRHFGLRFMRERADLLGSELTFESNPTTGTVVRLTIAIAEGS